MEVGEWYGDSFQPQSKQNQFGLAIQGLQKIGTDLAGQLTELPNNLLKIGSASLEHLVDTSIKQNQQRTENLNAGGATQFTQELKDSAEMLAEGATAGGWADLAGMGLTTASGADWVPEALRIPLLIGGIGLSAADGTPSPLSTSQLKTLSRVSPRALKALNGKKLTGSQINAAITPEGVLNRYGVYRKNPITGKKERVPLPDESALPTLGRKDQHHWIPKDTRHDFTQQANKLDPKGQAALDDIDAEYGLQAGGGEKGVTTMDMAAHLPLHGRIRSAGYELSGDQLKAFKKEIAGIKDIEQLKVVYRDWLEKNVIPTLNTVTALQGGYELLEASGGKVTKEALLNAAYGRGGWMERQLSVVNSRIERAIDQGLKPRKSDILFRARAEQDALNDVIIER